VLQARADEGRARSAFYPEIDLEAGISREEQGSSRGRSAFAETLYRGAVRLSYPLVDFGDGRRNRLLAARRALEARELRYNRRLQDLVLEVQRAYFAVQRRKADLAAAEETVKEARTTWEATRRLREAGSATVQELFQARARFEETRFERETEAAGLEEARANLAERIGVRVSGELRTVEPRAVRFDAATLESVDRLMERARRYRADRLALRAEAEAARRLREAAAGDYWPRLVLGGLGELERLERDRSEELADFRVGVALQWPVFRGFARDAEGLRRRAEAEEAEARLEQREIAIAGEVWTRFHQVESARRRIDAANARLEAAEKSTEFTRRTFDLGQSDLLHLLSVQRDLAEARSQVIEANASLAVALAELRHAVAPAEELPVLPAAGPPRK
jgi:outer membrane protein TolC